MASSHLAQKKMRSEEHYGSKLVKEKFDLPQFEKLLSLPVSNPSHRVRQDVDDETFYQPTRSRRRHSSERRETRSDELVKHMTNVPHYLLHADREESIHDNPLNFGVLDWTQLENWKHRQRHRPTKSSNLMSFHEGESSSRRATKSSATSTSIETSHKQGFYEGHTPDFHNLRRSQHFETEENRNDLGKSVPEVRTMASYLMEDRDSVVGNENRYGRDNGAEKSMKSLQEFNLKRKEKNRGFGFDMGLPSSEIKSKGIYVSSKKKGSSRSNRIRIKDEEVEGSNIDMMRSHDANHKQVHAKPKNIVLLHPREIGSGGNKTTTVDNQLQESDTDVNHKHGHRKPKNIVLLRPRPIPHSSDDFFESSRRRTSYDEFLAESSGSSVSSPYENITDEGACSKLPHSSEQCSMVQPVETLGSLLIKTGTDRGTDSASVASDTPSFSSRSSSLHSEGAYFERDSLSGTLKNHSEDACFERDDLSNKLTNQLDFSDLKEALDQEAAELAARKGRSLSSSRRFSFSLGRIGRSFSFKEGYNPPELSSSHVSAKSGPVTSSFSARWYSSSQEKENDLDRSRFTPLRKFLDPILKFKASKFRNSVESSSQVPKGNLDSMSFMTTSVSESLQDEMREGSLIQAHLQITIKNGLPFFSFVLNKDAGILAAAMKSLESSEKDDLNCYFIFYQLDKVKKKSGGWISHGSKEKGRDYTYNVVGQMRFSNSTITDKPGNQYSKTLSVQKEYVLWSVENDQADQEPPKFIRKGELAAAVVKIPFESIILKGLSWDSNLAKGCLKCSAGKRCTCNLGENDISGSTTVILPAGIHGSSDTSEPSPLIQRWRSGGQCDCGGWDIGCKLLVLSNLKLSSKSERERFQLFVEEGADEEDIPAFSLVPLKEGLYSVEFNSSITHLQAFFISLAALSCQRPSSIEMSIMQEQIFKDSKGLKSSNNLHGNAPVNYTPFPPPSPAGRV